MKKMKKKLVKKAKKAEVTKYESKIEKPVYDAETKRIGFVLKIRDTDGAHTGMKRPADIDKHLETRDETLWIYCSNIVMADRVHENAVTGAVKMLEVAEHMLIRDRTMFVHARDRIVKLTFLRDDDRVRVSDRVMLGKTTIDRLVNGVSGGVSEWIRGLLKGWGARLSDSRELQRLEARRKALLENLVTFELELKEERARLLEDDDGDEPLT